MDLNDDSAQSRLGVDTQKLGQGKTLLALGQKLTYFHSL